jgi:hypothetical protein
MADLQNAIEDFIAGLSADEARALWCRTREPSEPIPPESHTSRET